MIQANELRIGNWVFDEDNTYAQVETVRSGRFIEWNGMDDEPTTLSLPNDNAMYGGNINPIPLTPEILEKCGFERQGKIFEFRHKNGLQICLCWGNIWRNVNNLFEDLYDEPIVNHLHQLQNLYFALTGKELTYNP